MDCPVKVVRVRLKSREGLMKRKWGWAAAALIVLLYTGTGLGDGTVLKDFVSFDKAFIPPLALTNQEKVAPSKKAIEILKEEWGRFRSRHYEANAKDAKWKQDLDSVGAKIQDAERIILGEKNLMEAHEILETIRYAFMDARKRNGIEYYIDHLSEFHEHMEAIVHAASDAGSASLAEKEKSFISRECGEAMRIWAGIQRLPFDKELFGFDDRRETKRQELLQKEAEALLTLQKSLESNDAPRIIRAAKEVRPNYAQLYMLFGDFSRFGG
jgi:hypothetical protein